MIARMRAASFAIAVVWGTVACGTSGPVGPIVHERHSIERGAAMTARVEIGMSAGEIAVKSGAKTLFEGDFDFNVPSLKSAWRG